MIITKVIETSIDLDDPDSEIYNPNKEELCMTKLEKRYVGKCYQSMFINKISKIIRISDVIMVDNRNDGMAYLDVQFEVTGIYFITGEILNGNEIKKIGTNIILAQRTHASIHLKPDPTKIIYNSLSLGQKIPVVVINSSYSINKDEITITAAPFTPVVPDKEINYSITRALNPEEIEQVEYVTEQIRLEEELHSKISSQESYKIFKDMIYPYKNKQKFELSVQGKEFTPVKLELKELLMIDSGTIKYPSHDEKSNKRLFWSNKNINDPNTINVSSTLSAILLNILNLYLSYMQSIREFVETYPKPPDYLVNYYKICQKLKV